MASRFFRKGDESSSSSEEGDSSDEEIEEIGPRISRTSNGDQVEAEAGSAHTEPADSLRGEFSTDSEGSDVIKRLNRFPTRSSEADDVVVRNSATSNDDDSYPNEFGSTSGHINEVHKNFLTSAILERLSTFEAREELNSQSESGKSYELNDPEVTKLARKKFDILSQRSAQLNISHTLFAADEYKDARDSYGEYLQIATKDATVTSTASALQRAATKMQTLRPEVTRQITRAQLEHGKILRQENEIAAANTDRTLVRRPSLVPHSNYVGDYGLDMALAPYRNTRISRYFTDFEEVGFLGRGGFGRVYEVIHRIDRMQYAVKQIFVSKRKLEKLSENGLVEGKNYLQALVDEVKVMASLDHPNIVRYYDAWIEDSADLRSKESRVISTEVTPSFGSRFASQRLLGAGQEWSDNVTFAHSSAKSIADPRDDMENVDCNDFIDATSTEAFSDTSNNETQYNNEPGYLIYIRMSLHRLGLIDFLSQPPARERGQANDIIRHCFHVEPSVKLFLAVLSGVEYLHDRDFVHRDLKPGNIWFDVLQKKPATSGFIKLDTCSKCKPSAESQLHIYMVPRIGDFGLVATLKHPEDHKSTSSLESTFGSMESMFGIPTPPKPAPTSSFGMKLAQANKAPKAVGTELYRPPPIEGEPVEICHGLDVFSLGIILFELVWPMETQFERKDTLMKLNEGNFPKQFSAKIADPTGVVESSIRGMLHTIRRWTCEEVRCCLQAFLDGKL